jgi:parallel beta-helix repeat protein
VSHVSRRNFLKKAIPVIAGVGLAGALRIDPGFASSVSPSVAPPSPGNQLSTASYVIYREKIFYAQNGTTGRIDYSGVDAATVIQSAIDALTDGGLVVLRRGVYSLTRSIIVRQGIDLLGEQGAVLRVGDSSQNSTNPFNLLEVMGDNATIENIELDGNAASNPNLAGTTSDAPPANPNIQSAIVVRSGQSIEIVNCYIHDTWNAGIWLAATDGDVLSSEIASCQIERTGKSYTDPSSTNPPQSASAVYVFRLQATTSGSNIHDNMISETYGRGIYLHFETDSIVSNNTLTKTPEASAETAGIAVDDGAKRIIVRGNHTSGYGPGILVVWGGCQDIIIDSNGCFDAPNSGGAGSGILVDTSTSGGPPQRSLIIKANICKGNALPGITIAASETLIEGNICYNNNQDSKDNPLRMAGIVVQTGQSPLISDVSIIGNRCFDDQDLPTQNYGVSITQMSNQIMDVLVSNNDLRGNGIGGIGGIDCKKLRVTGNLGYNPQGLAPIIVGNSPFTYTNQDGVPEAVYISGGLVSEISKEGTVVFTSAPATVWLEPDESVTVSHSDPPQMMRDKH